MGKRPGNIPGELLEDPGYLVRSVSANSSQCDENALPSWDGMGREIFSRRKCVWSACKWVKRKAENSFCI